MSGKKKSDWEQPSLTLLIKVGSAVVHAQEFISAGGHVFDLQAFHAMVSDPEVKAWLEQGTKLSYLPVKR